MTDKDLQARLAAAERTIRALQEELAESNRGLVALDLELEQRVERRTAALVRVNEALRAEIAERKRIEKEREELLVERKQQSKFHESLIDNAPIGIAVVDRDMRYVLANPAYRSIAGPPDTAVAGRTVAEVFAPEMAQIIEPFVRPVFASGEPQQVLNCEAPVHGHTWWNVSAIPLRDAAGNVEAVLILTEEVTDRKQAEASLAAAKASAEQAKAAAEQANRAKDHFLAVLSHELRTPLTPVVMGLSMLMDKQDLDPTLLRQTLEMIRRNVEMEAHLIDDLLDVTRIARGKIALQKQRVELCAVIQRAVEVCKPDLDARALRFGLDLGPAAPYWIEGDPARLQQVFWNLLKNAIKFTPPGGSVTVRCQASDQQVVAELSDSGIGIEPEALTRIFTAFEQADRSITQQFGGLGLGLAISRALVELHGGSMCARSEGRNRGATFRVELPLTVRAGQPEPSPSSAPPPLPQRPLRILLVEDHAVTAKMTKMLLAMDGHAVEMASNVSTALEMANHHDFDLLMSDLGLPDGTGHDLMRQLRELGRRFPGIALSGYGQEDDIQRSYQAGFSAHLTKPASREAIVEAIAAVTSGQTNHG